MMGNILNPNDSQPTQERGRKRKVDDVELEEERNKEQDENLRTPKRKKLQSTTRYIYETLFVKGEKSDVTIVALGKKWPLHKVYLCQSKYFASMFSGSWKESEQEEIRMLIPDDNINENALSLALGSLYKDDILIAPNEVVGVLAAATLIGLDGLINQCVEVMKETICAKTVCHYHTASVLYGQQGISKLCLDWLEKNMMTSQTVSLLGDVSVELLEQIVHSTDFYVMQVEMDIYSMLKKWLFIQITPTWDGTFKQLTCDTEAFFKMRGSNSREFLLTEDGCLFSKVFRGLRLQHIVNDLASAKVLEADKIIPRNWLHPVYKNQWMQMLRVESGLDKGPDEVDFIHFHSHSMRCGRVLQRDGQYCWRWTGYNFGLDLLVSITNKILSLKRNTNSQICPGSVSLHQKRHILFRITVTSLDPSGHTVYTKSSGAQRLSLNKDEDAIIMPIDRAAKFPLYVSANFMVYKPPLEDFSASAKTRNDGGVPAVVHDRSAPGDQSQNNNHFHEDQS